MQGHRASPSPQLLFGLATLALLLGFGAFTQSSINPQCLNSPPMKNMDSWRFVLWSCGLDLIEALKVTRWGPYGCSVATH